MPALTLSETAEVVRIRAATKARGRNVWPPKRGLREDGARAQPPRKPANAAPDREGIRVYRGCEAQQKPLVLIGRA